MLFLIHRKFKARTCCTCRTARVCGSSCGPWFPPAFPWNLFLSSTSRDATLPTACHQNTLYRQTRVSAEPSASVIFTITRASLLPLTYRFNILREDGLRVLRSAALKLPIKTNYLYRPCGGERGSVCVRISLWKYEGRQHYGAQIIMRS